MTLAIMVAGAVMSNVTTTKVEAAEPPIDVKAPSAILVDADTGRILYEKNADVKRSPASMTKMMAEYLILEAIKKGTISWDTPVRINDYIYKLSQNRNLSGVPLRKDVTYTVQELYKAMAIYSANSATIAIGRKIYGSEKKFVEAMNEKAEELGLKDTKFVNSTGLNNSDLMGHEPFGGPNDENVMSAHDAALLAYRLVKDHPNVLKYTSIPKAKFTKGVESPINMPNWNFMLPGLVFEYEGVLGLKTGHTDKAGYCFTSYAERGDVHLISVVMKTDSLKQRFAQTRVLLDYGFNNFHKVTLLNKGYQPKGKKQLPVVKGKEDQVGIEAKQSIQLLIRSGTKNQYKPKVTFDESLFTKDGALTAPVKKGQQVGTVTIENTKTDTYGYLTKQQAAQAASAIVTTGQVEKASWFSLMFRSIGHGLSHFFSGIGDMIKGWF
ncbi:MAG TPA: serine hydrolase [Bacillales bacterium]|nr:serine hydrolase [Bacillales bacterium]